MNDLNIFHIKEKCTACGACSSICPKGCLLLKSDEDGFYYPSFVNDQCVNCHLCENVCHILSYIPNKIKEKGVYYYYDKDTKVVEESSSGGAFTLFTKYVLNKGGIVYGSRYNPEQERLQVDDSDECDWKLFRKSKYVETFIGEKFKDIGKSLLLGRNVLYCGTPCQIIGLRNYLKNKKIQQETLLAVDFLCHGVPSNKCFTLFKRRYENKKRKLQSVDFRYKDFSVKGCGWHDLNMKLLFSNGEEKIIPYAPPHSFYYYKIFVDDLAHRLSCFNCHYPEFSDADITIGDFWTINNSFPGLDNNKGVSFIKINSEHGEKIWNELKTQGICQPVPYEHIKFVYENKKDRTGNIANRDRFLSEMRQNGLGKAVRLFYGKGLLDYYIIGWIKDLVKKRIKKIL